MLFKNNFRWSLACHTLGHCLKSDVKCKCMQHLFVNDNAYPKVQKQHREKKKTKQKQNNSD